MDVKKIKYIVIHCSAGFAERESIEKFWKSMGWKSPGYHRLISVDGTIQKLSDFNKSTNGVLGYNDQSIHICYIGGIDKTNVNKAVDTRTDKQKGAIINCIVEAIKWLRSNGNTNKLMILGHRDFSKDKNKNNIIESWERIKECPSFDAIKEYNWIVYSNNNPADILPNK